MKTEKKIKSMVRENLAIGVGLFATSVASMFLFWDTESLIMNTIIIVLFLGEIAYFVYTLSFIREYKEKDYLGAKIALDILFFERIFNKKRFKEIKKYLTNLNPSSIF